MKEILEKYCKECKSIVFFRNYAYAYKQKSNTRDLLFGINSDNSIVECYIQFDGRQYRTIIFDKKEKLEMFFKSLE